MLRVGSEYNTELQKLVLQIKKVVEAEMLPVIQQEQPNYTADAWPERVQSILDRLRLMYFMPGFESTARRVASKFVRSTLNFADRKNRGFGIEVFNGNSTQLNNYLEAATLQNADLIKSIPARYLDDVAGTVQSAMRVGLMPSAIAKELQLKYGIAQRRAKFIARDQAAKVNGEITKQRQIDAGFEYFGWIDADDSRVRHRHREIANADVGYGKGIYKWSELPKSSDGTTIQPGSDYQCFTGESKVNIFAGAKKVFRHRYTGELTSLRTSDGSVCESTANHPILTNRGFKAAHEINVGDYIVKVPSQRIVAGECDAQSLDVSFSKVFGAFRLMGIHESTSAFGGEFHGDTIRGEQINVVAIDWSLPDGFNASACKKFSQELFSVSDQMIPSLDASSFGDFCSVLKGVVLASDSVVSSFGKLLTFDRAGLGHSDEHSLASIGLLYSRFIQNSSDDVARGVEFLGDCFDTHLPISHRANLFKRYVLLISRFSFGLGNYKVPGANGFGQIVGVDTELGSGGFEIIPLQYEFVAVIDKTIREFDGHVFNLEMDNGLFVAQDTAVSNCRCIGRPVRTSVVEETIAKRKKTLQSDKSMARA